MIDFTKCQPLSGFLYEKTKKFTILITPFANKACLFLNNKRYSIGVALLNSIIFES